ncbi:MAG: S8 family serine peptidase [Acidobacteria bacterium]|nr:S8 family serine peptidase [Acidobacteriota bacterium]
MKINMRLASVAGVFVLASVFLALFGKSEKAAASTAAGLTVIEANGESVLVAEGLGEIYRSPETISDAQVITFAKSPAKVFTWYAGFEPFYAVSTDGKSVKRVNSADHRMMLRYGNFDPLSEIPPIAENLTATAKYKGSERAYIVQFVTQPIDEYRQQLSDAGAKIRIYLPNHAYLVSMAEEVRGAVSALPYVRWVGRYEPAYKLEEVLIESLSDGPAKMEPARYNIMTLERGAAAQYDISAMVSRTGGVVENIIPEGFRMEATLTGEQLLQIAQHEKVLFIDRWSPPENDMDIVRSVGGANYVESVAGYRGQGVRAEVMDNGLRQTHNDFQLGGPPLIHNSPNTSEGSNHGTSTYGINFGRGISNPAGRGMMPEATGIFADYDFLSNRYTHTAELKQDPYKAVYQSNSWGNATTTAYTTISAEMDDITFINDFVILNSQSNTGNQLSRPQAWAKNVVSIGGIRHYNTASLTDDRWANGASVGPAADGRLKPDLAHFYDSIFTTSNSSDAGYTTGFGGTSAATPITAGHFGLFFQMWHNGIFGNPTGPTVFDSRPRMATAKAVMINTAVQWDMNIPGTDTTRVRQGWGRVDLQNLYNLRTRLFVVNEEVNLTNLQSQRYRVRVVPSQREPMKITLVYTDPMGSPSASRARINDLTLRVTAPDGTVYWGNNGLGVGGGMWSTPGGTGNIVDTVENVFISNPMLGTWFVDIFANEVVTDAVPSTPEVDATFSLVASGPISLV